MEILPTYSNLSAKKLDQAIKAKEHGRYVMLYLYDRAETMLDDSATMSLFTKYGKRINSRLGGDIILLTVYDKRVIDAWGDDYMGKEKLTKQFTYQETYSEKNHYSLMKDLALFYDVRLPALILIDTKGDEKGREQVVKKELDLWSAEDIYRYIIKIADTIRDCYDDFERISYECKAGCSSEERRIKELLEVQPSLKEIFERYKHEAKCTQNKLCAELGINTRTLHRYLNEWDSNGKSYPLPRDTAIAIAFILKLTPEKADAMFDAAMVEPIPRLGYAGRDGIIRDCLKDGFDLETTNRELAKYQWQTVNIPSK